MQYVESFIPSFDKTKIHYKEFNSKPSDRVVLITHGLGEHSGSYFRLVQGLNQLPCPIVAWDLRGHGKSEGQRGFVNSFEDYIGDFCSVIRHLKKDHKKIQLISHSMGALVTLNSLPEISPELIHGLVLSSPFLDIGLTVPTVKKIAAEFLKNFANRITVNNEISNSLLTSDLDVLREYPKDPYRHNKISFQLYNDFFKYFQKAESSVSQLWMPTLVQYANLDQVVSNKKIEELFKPTKVSLIKYEQSRHEIYNDLERQKAFEDLNQFLKKIKFST